MVAEPRTSESLVYVAAAAERHTEGFGSLESPDTRIADCVDESSLESQGTYFLLVVEIASSLSVVRASSSLARPYPSSG